MKLRQKPEDFFVEELTDVRAGATGEFALYRLEKRGWTTPEAIQVISRRWKLDWRRVSHGGLKDRHAHTIQFLTIRRGPARKLTHQRLQLEFLGLVHAPFSSRDVQGNRFRLAVRALREVDVDLASAALEKLASHGVPNYFDDQRFGSVSGGEFVAKALVLGDFERALRLALAAPYEHDRAAQKKEKKILEHHWGNWESCLKLLPRGHTRRIIDHLVQQPGDFRGAVARLHPELRGLYLSAYQSHLWNRMLARWLREHLGAEQITDVELRLAKVPFHRLLTAEQRSQMESQSLPLPTARGSVDDRDPSVALMQSILSEEGLTRDQIKVKGLREVFFSRGERAALCLPKDLKHETSEDELNAGRKKMVLSFELPRGSYATLIVKRAFGQVDHSSADQ